MLALRTYSNIKPEPNLTFMSFYHTLCLALDTLLMTTDWRHSAYTTPQTPPVQCSENRGPLSEHVLTKSLQKHGLALTIFDTPPR